MPDILVIAAVCNEEENLPVFVSELEALDLPAGVTLRLLLVEDSSSDGTPLVLRELSERYSWVGFHRLEQGFGQGPAIVFGLSQSQFDAAIMMDADGGHPVSAIPEMIRFYLNGAQIVQARRRSFAGREVYRRRGATLFQSGARLVLGGDIEDQSIFYRLVSAEWARRLVARPLYWRWLRFPLPRAVGAVRFIDVDCHQRTRGQSKYNFKRLAILAMDGVLSMMSVSRFLVFMTVGALVVALSWSVGLWPFSIALAVAMAALIGRYLSMSRSNVLQAIRVIESDTGMVRSGGEL